MKIGKILLVIGALSFAPQIVKAQETVKIFGFVDTTQAFEYEKPIDSLKNSDFYYIEQNQGIIHKKFDQGYHQLEVHHNRVHINNEKGLKTIKNYRFGDARGENHVVDYYYKIYKPNGKVITLDSTEIIPNKDKKGLFSVKWSQLEVGDQIEFAIGLTEFSRKYMSFQLMSAYPIVNSKFTFIHPSEIAYEASAVGIEDKVMYQMSDNEAMKIYYCNLKDVPAIKQEQYSFPFYQVWSITFSLMKEDGIQFQASNWDPYANTYYSLIDDNSKKIGKIENIAKKIKIDTNSTQTEKVLGIENYIKTQFKYFPEMDKYLETANINKSIKSGKINHLEKLALTKALFDYYKIDYELSFAATRSDEPFNPFIPNPNRINEIAFYIPAEDAYVFPIVNYIRAPYMPAIYEATDFVHIRKSYTANEGDYFAQFQYVKEMPLEYSASNFTIDVNINPNEWTANSTLVQSGHYNAISAFMHEVYKVNKTKSNIIPLNMGYEFYDSLFEVNNTNTNYKGYFDGKGTSTYSAQLKGKQKPEIAPGQLSIPLGSLIGKQARMEPDSNRMFNIDIENPHQMKRLITVNLPAGYQVKNLNELNIEYKDEENQLGFVSKTDVQNNILTINIDEYYGQSRYDKSLIDVFQKVINAAADFNDLNLILEKK